MSLFHIKTVLNCCTRSDVLSPSLIPANMCSQTGTERQDTLSDPPSDSPCSTLCILLAELHTDCSTCKLVLSQMRGTRRSRKPTTISLAFRLLVISKTVRTHHLSIHHVYEILILHPHHNHHHALKLAFHSTITKGPTLQLVHSKRQGNFFVPYNQLPPQKNITKWDTSNGNPSHKRRPLFASKPSQHNTYGPSP